MTPKSLKVVEQIEKATQSTDLFTPGVGAMDQYKDLLKSVHPDRFAEAYRARADAAARKLGELYAALSAPKPPSQKFGRWETQQVLFSGHLADVHYATAGDKTAAVKVVRNAADNDLMASEFNVLRTLWKDTDFRECWKYLPCPVETFKTTKRSVNVFGYETDCVRLCDVAKAADFESGIPFQHIVWMGNRILSALMYVHAAGFVVHGAITPAHLLYRPKDHGMVLVGWCAAQRLAKTHIPIVDPAWEHLYPTEVKRKMAAHPATDVYMAMNSLLSVAGAVPKPFLPIFDHCLAASVLSRPCDVTVVQDRWQAAAKQVYGPPKFVQLHCKGL